MDPSPQQTYHNRKYNEGRIIELLKQLKTLQPEIAHELMDLLYTINERDFATVKHDIEDGKLYMPNVDYYPPLNSK